VRVRGIDRRRLSGDPLLFPTGEVRGEAVLASAQRKPEVVLMSQDPHGTLATTRERAVLSAVTSMGMEGLPPGMVEMDAARELAAGRINFADYRRRVNV